MMDMPLVHFEGQIEVIDSLADVRRAVRLLHRQQAVGIDTETRPSFVPEITYQVALLQVSTLDICFLFRLNRLGMPDEIREFLGDESCTKVGLSLNDDIRSLHGRADFQMKNYVELQQEVAKIGVQDRSLQKLYANLFHHRISKRQQLSNWEARELTEAQKRYAATDAWACLRIYHCLESFKKNHDYKINLPFSADNLLDRVVGDMTKTVGKSEQREKVKLDV